MMCRQILLFSCCLRCSNTYFPSDVNDSQMKQYLQLQLQEKPYFVVDTAIAGAVVVEFEGENESLKIVVVVKLNGFEAVSGFNDTVFEFKFW